jgi:hypothetical protein
VKDLFSAVMLIICKTLEYTLLIVQTICNLCSRLYMKYGKRAITYFLSILAAIFYLVVVLACWAFGLAGYILPFLAGNGEASGLAQCPANSTLMKSTGLEPNCCSSFFDFVGRDTGNNPPTLVQLLANELGNHPITAELPVNWEGTPRIRQLVTLKLEQEIVKKFHNVWEQKYAEDLKRQNQKLEDLKREMAHQTNMMNIMSRVFLTYGACKLLRVTGRGFMNTVGGQQLREATNLALRREAFQAFPGMGRVLDPSLLTTVKETVQTAWSIVHRDLTGLFMVGVGSVSYAMEQISRNITLG